MNLDAVIASIANAFTKLVEYFLDVEIFGYSETCIFIDSQQ